ncbi:2-hydroxyacyl-CoA dehydratase [Desulfallas sp. Bu1-1]|uniref:2-hydroxyacyl-CoA dehydratase subunit D n=1 Tax=Desulfallas sp. Bu1-1 TaxID=2787620 RepID=UPI00189DF259|nr:2-hydroxyacyl-CoA dehydratase family protein [Desulfallas sp. Bu1-1]MBF7082584.1 2-hydroxyacyl-CoA dehydratase [Desulfallas sp. Bu1-1]
MDFYRLVKEKMGGDLGRHVLRSPLSYNILKALLVKSRHQYSLQAVWMMNRYALEQTRRAYLRRDPVIWNSVFFPTEILHALKAVPFAPEVGAAVAAGLGLATKFLGRAEQYWSTRDTCSFHRCAMGSVLEEYLPAPDALVYSSHLCDGAPKLFEHVAAFYKKPVFFLDVPGTGGDAAVDYVAGQLEEIAGRLSHRLGRPLTRDNLARALENSNQAREYMLKINELRRATFVNVPGSQALNFVYLLFTAQGAPETVQIYRQFYRDLEGLAGRGDRAVPERRRLLWLHLKPYYRNGLMEYLENRLGAALACEEMNHVYWEPLDPERPYESLARKALSHFALGPVERRIETLLQLVRLYRIDGVVHFTHWGCRQSNGGLRPIKEALRSAGVPFLSLDGDCVDGRNYGEGQLLARLEGFIEMIDAK